MFRVRIEAEARNNLRKHYQNLRARDPGSEYPDRWYYGIRSAIRDLAASARECGPAYEDRFFAETIRQRLFESYKILFAIREDAVHVLHIRHQAQDPEDLIA
ncbi:MAG TPA: type II toxin-antitoxin system RelE/ParE family toxin [Rubellimicrobium sp.]|nr:type II toxin-antitoxin system RelE/ParE family toxin [Rubellimicrobium sp.]